MDELIVGRADAIACADDGTKIVFDWKSDVAPTDADRTAYARQLGQYLHAVGAWRGAIVYMTSGHIDWVSSVNWLGCGQLPRQPVWQFRHALPV
jgi:CRISPR-associated exonuclease Cas4